MSQYLKLFQVVVSYNCNKNCSYCFANALKDQYEDMSLENFSKLLEWMEKNNIKKFNISGGEPTIHPHISEFIDLAKDKGFNFTIFSNGLFNSSLMENFKKADSFLINYNPRNHYTEREFALLQENMAALVKNNVKISIQFNITEDITSCDHILKACEEYCVKDVNLDFIAPNALQSNAFVNTKDFKQRIEMLVSFVDALKKKGMKVRITRPMPRCSYTREQKEILGDQTYHVCGVGYSVITINPDLSTFPCLGIFFRGRNITEFKDLNQYRNFYKNAMSNLRWKRKIKSECEKCVYLRRRQCQGACLCYKCKKFTIVKTKRYVLYSQYEQSDVGVFIMQLEHDLDVLDKIFNKQLGRIKVFMFDNYDDLTFYSGGYNLPRWAVGWVNNPDMFFQLGKVPLTRNRHELCHLYIYDTMKANLPQWLQQGFCEYVGLPENKNNLMGLMRIKKMIHFSDTMDWRDHTFLKHDSDTADKNIFFNQSHSFVRYLVTTYGLEKVMELIKGVYDDFPEFFKGTYGKSLDEMEADWLSYLNQKI